MSEPAAAARVRRLLTALLILYPPWFRRELGPDLVETAAHRWAESRRRARWTAWLRFWLTDGLRFVLDGVLERASSARFSWLDARGAWRQVRRAPGHHALAVVTLALGVGATTAIFTVADAVVFRPLPYPDADELYLVQPRFGALELSSNSLPNIRDIEASVRSFSWLGAATDRSPALTDRSAAPERVSVLDVTAAYLPGLGARVGAGRAFVAADFTAGAERVAILSDALAERRWGDARSAVGETVRLDGVAYLIAGVMAPSFRDPEPIESGAVTGAWVPARDGEGAFAHRDAYWFRLLGRLAPGDSPESARRELTAEGLRLAAAYPAANTVDGDSLGFVLHALRETTVGDARNRLLLLLGAVTLLLVLACANVASLFLARGVVRAPELAVRSALGATRVRLAAQLFAESLLTATLAGAAGGLIGLAGLRLFLALAPKGPTGIPRLREVALDTHALLFVAGLTILIAIIFGTLPALRGARVATFAAAGARATDARTTQRIQSLLVAGEVAVAFVLVMGSALLLNSFAHLLRVDPGFDADDVIVVDVRPPFIATSAASETAFHSRLLDGARALPGVSTAAMMYTVPGVSGGAWMRVSVEGEATASGDRRTRAPAVGQSPGDDFFRMNPVFGAVFDALDMPLRAGHAFEGDEGRGDPLVVILNEAAARRFFPRDPRPLGRRLALGTAGSGAPMREVIGIVGDVRQLGPGRDADPQIYVPYGQRPGGRLSLILELRPGAAVPAAAVRRLATRVAPDLPVDRIAPLSVRYAATGAQARFLAFLLSVLAGIGLVLAAAGTFATTAHAVSRRVREVGIRIALGARPASVLRLVFGRALRTAGSGILAGLVLAIPLAHFLEAYLFGITTRDPLTVAAAVAVIAGCAILASLGPALRAARVDPNRVLRSD